MARYGQEAEVPAGTLLFSRGQREADFFVVLEGSIEIFDVDPWGEPHVVTVHGAGQFTGDVDLLNGREILVQGRVGVLSRLVRVPQAAFRRMLSAEPEIAEIVMRAFILRRVLGVAVMDVLAAELENPFGIDCNDLPTRAIAETIRRQVHEILEVERHGRPDVEPATAAVYTKIF